MANVQVPLKLKLWRTLGCHELLASLGFDLVGVGKQEVMLRSGKANSRRALQCTVQALCALTGKREGDDAATLLRIVVAIFTPELNAVFHMSQTLCK